MSRDYWGVWLLAAIIVAIAVNPLRVRLVREWLKRHKRPLKYADLRVHVEGADDPGQPRDPGKYEGRDQPRPQPGDRRFSAYFNSIVELVDYRADDNYFFKPLTGELAGKVLKNQSRWSILPLRRP
jgi:hypothetical protein